MGEQRRQRRRPVRHLHVDPVITMPDLTPTKPGPGETVTESEHLPDPQGHSVKDVKDPHIGSDAA